MASASFQRRQVGRRRTYNGRLARGSPRSRCADSFPEYPVPATDHRAYRTSPVRHSLRANPLTVLTLFVNPTQFAPHEDLSSYPRTLARDLELLEGLLSSEYPGKEVDKLVVWTPSRETMYPLSSLPAPASASGSTGEGMLQDVNKQRGAFVEVKGWGDVLEGASRRKSARDYTGGIHMTGGPDLDM